MDEICLEMRQITRWERGQRLILDHVDFSVSRKEKVLIKGDIREDTQEMFANILCRDHTGTISGSGTDESNGLHITPAACRGI